MTPEQISKELDGRQVRFILGISSQDFAPACRWEDRARQKLRKAGLVRFERKGAKWLLTPLGEQVRAILENEND